MPGVTGDASGCLFDSDTETIRPAADTAEDTVVTFVRPRAVRFDPDADEYAAGTFWKSVKGEIAGTE